VAWDHIGVAGKVVYVARFLHVMVWKGKDRRGVSLIWHSLLWLI